MSYFRHKGNVIEIDDVFFDEEVLLSFDPAYSKPDGWIRCYIQNKKHYLTNGTNQIGSTFPWDDGDKYIKSIVELKFIEKQIELDKQTNA